MSPVASLTEDNGWIVVNDSGDALTYKGYTFGANDSVVRGGWFAAGSDNLKALEVLDDLSDANRALITEAIYNTADGDSDGEFVDELATELATTEAFNTAEAATPTARAIASLRNNTNSANVVNIGPSPLTVVSESSGTPASVRLDPDASHKADNHGEVYISMDMHKLTIGSDLDAGRQTGRWPRRPRL